MKDIFRVAIDGPSGAGKSTIAKAVASGLNIDYIDTGAMYRAIGYKAGREGVAPEEGAALEEMLARTEIDFAGGRIYLDGADVESFIRTPEVSMLASQYSALPSVREKLVELQRDMASRKSVIMDGRDIGTNVLKDAEYKIYLTASAGERAERRCRELEEKGTPQNYEDVLRDIEQRDHNDMTRKLNPLRKADDAIEVDTTGMSIQEVIDRVIDIVYKN
ncbi:MAG: (d)CMP kinase [Clostridiales bacterium]|nr:(d)CMP kinase [Clostridiales bacterium]MDD7035954.1 (d)CMP kinase [Bacillota bacterium]MDY2920490.1 (d)CMP kinase [Lentihominibacter sp.]